MNKSAARASIWLWLTAPIAILITVATVSELLIGGLFHGDTIYLVAQARGQDVITLAIALPALVVGALLAARNSERGRLIWLGALVYLVYTYAIYAFHVRFNSLFLVYVALLGCSLYALIGGLATTDFGAVKARLSKGRSVTAVSVFLGLVAVLFYFAWLGEVVPALVSGDVPRSVVDNGTPTSGVHVLDMAWILPAMVLTSVWLRRGRALGYALAGVLLAFLSLLAAAIMAMMVAMWVYGQPVALGMAAVFGIVSAISLGMLVWYLKGLGKVRARYGSNARSTPGR